VFSMPFFQITIQRALTGSDVANMGCGLPAAPLSAGASDAMVKQMAVSEEADGSACEQKRAPDFDK